MTNKEKYQEFCKTTYVPIFSKPFWLDAVCFDGYWDVLIYEKNNEIIGALPYYVRKIFNISFIQQPKHTQNNGVIIKYPNNISHSKRLSLEKDVMSKIIEQLEQLGVSFYMQGFSINITNWQPFYWKNYKQTTCYTYRINNIKDETIVFNNFDYSKRKNIKKALKEVVIRFDLPPKDFYDNHRLSLMKQKQKVSYSYEHFERIYNAIYQHNCGFTIYAEDINNNIHGALFIIFDEKAGYDLISTIDPDYRNSGAASLLVYEAIKYVSKYVDIFDFEGSMIENVENSFRKFGSIQTPYFRIHKIYTKNPIIRFLVNKKLKH